MPGPADPPTDLRSTLTSINAGVSLHSQSSSSIPSLPTSAKVTLLEAQIQTQQARLVAQLRQHTEHLSVQAESADALPHRVEQLRARIARLRAAPSLAPVDVAHDVCVPLYLMMLENS